MPNILMKFLDARYFIINILNWNDVDPTVGCFYDIFAAAEN